MSQIVSIFTSFSRRRHISSLPVTNEMSLILESLEVSVMFFKRDLSLIYLLIKYMKDFLLGYDSNSRVYRVFNKDSDCVETTCDTVFDETNGFQVEQYDLDIIDDEESPCEALQRMAIGDVRPQDPSEPQASIDTTPPTQDDEQNQEDELDEDQAHDQV
jgi:hypothetical protein